MDEWKNGEIENLFVHWTSHKMLIILVANDFLVIRIGEVRYRLKQNEVYNYLVNKPYLHMYVTLNINIKAAPEIFSRKQTKAQTLIILSLKTHLN